MTPIVLPGEHVKQDAVDFYKEAGKVGHLWDPFMLYEAERAGVPVPFYTVEGEMKFASGLHITVRFQYRELPTNEAIEQLRTHLWDVAHSPPISDSITLTKNYDPREWR